MLQSRYANLQFTGTTPQEPMEEVSCQPQLIVE